MAEAHQASIISVMFEDQKPTSTTFQVLTNIIRSYVYDSIRANYRIKNKLYNGLYPAKPSNIIYVSGAVFTASVFGFDPSFGIIEKIEIFFQTKFDLQSPRDHILASFIFSMGVWLSFTFTRKRIMHMLFSYTGWIYESHGHVRLSTKIWMILVRAVCGNSKPKLYSYQKSLPTLPLPRLKHTIDRYLRSIKPFKSEKDFIEMQQLGKQFRRKYGCRVQLFLYLKYLFVNNYVSDWWEEYVYLANRSPLIVNSNYYGIDAIFTNHNWQQSARAANLICASVSCMNLIKREELVPIILHNTIPLCSSQYERLFGTTRIPRFVKDGSNHGDEIVQTINSNHIVVLHKGRFFKCLFRDKRKYLRPVDIEVMMQSILDDVSEPVSDEQFIPVLTAGNRNNWAHARDNYFSSGINKQSLDIVETAAFVLVLEETSQTFDPKDESKLDSYAQALIHGNGYNMWLDKSFNIIVFKNGRVGFNAEHSWADAPIMSHFWEYILLEDSISPNYGYTPSGHCRGIPNPNIPKVERLKWIMSSKLHESIDVSLRVVDAIIKDLDIHVLVHEKFGKGLMKKCKVSPDGFVQLALQLTYYRTMGGFCQTYEASMTRIFLEGRTETVRSCTIESCAFVKAMEDPSVPKTEKLRLFKVAADYHQMLYRDAMTGKGVDRHLFCIYIMCKFLRIESEFLNKVFAQPWKLSTSQTPSSQLTDVDITRYPDFVCAGGGFGPVADDGFGISYIVVGEDRLFFHISSKFSCKETNSKEFSKNLCKALQDLREMFGFGRN